MIGIGGLEKLDKASITDAILEGIDKFKTRLGKQPNIALIHQDLEADEDVLKKRGINVKKGATLKNMIHVGLEENE